MESESVLSEPSTTATQNGRSFANNEKSLSLAQLSITSTKTPHTPRVAKLETLEAKMASIEVSLSSTANRRRKSSIGRDSSSKSTVSSRSEIAPSRELRSALQDREAVIQNLRLQLGLAKLPRPVGPPFDETEKPVAEKKLTRLKIEAENKRVGIRNLKSAMEKLEISDNSNIDTRIRQAELEYALGRDELQLLSLVEEARAVQSRLEKSNAEAKSIYQLLKLGNNLLLHALEATPGRWNATIKNELTGFVVDWALDGEGLCRGDRIVEVNGKMLIGSSREELQKHIGIAGKCELVVLRKHSSTFTNQQLQQSQADNLRLQHRISYLEEQVRELQEPKMLNGKEHQMNGQNGGHITSISISSPPSTPPEQHKPQIYQRGSYVTTIVGGKAVDPPPQLAMKSASSVQNITKTIIKENHRSDSESFPNVLKNNIKNSKSISTSTISINSDTTLMHKKERDKQEREIRRMEREKYIQQHSNTGKVHRSEDNGRLFHRHLHNGNNARSVDHLNSIDRRRISCLHSELSKRNGIDARSVKSLDIESDNGNVDYTSEPVVVRAGRPTPPKKPIRLSLHRAQSLQTVDGSCTMSDYEKKRTLKRAHKSEKANNLAMKYIENSLIPNHTSSLGRQKFIEKLIKI